MKMLYNGVECNIKARSELSVEIGELCSEAVIYAICRLFAKTPSFCRKYAMESYRMRLSVGKDRKPKRHKCIVPAFLAEIDAELLQIDFTVDFSGITITAIRPLRYISE